MLQKLQVTFVAPFARKVPDPNFKESHGIERHIWFVPVRSVPRGLPLDPNPRVPNVSKRIYREIERSLLNEEVEPGTFHLKHKGITLIADRVDPVREVNDHYVVTLAEGQGILDGGHTYQLILEHLEDDDLPAEQFVKFEILTHVPPVWMPEIAGGLNTSVQVQAMSLDNLEGIFEWIKAELRDEPYYGKIAWRENEPGDFDARDIVSLLTLFNIYEFPNNQEDQPVEGYEKKSNALKRFEARPESYKRLSPILKEILILHDTIRRDSRDLWNSQVPGGKFGNFSFVESKKRGFEFPFTGKRADYRLMNGALYPILAAFRWMVEDDPMTYSARWRGGFQHVIERWEASAAELLRMTQQANDELGRNPNAIGKSRNHWANLHARVAMRELMAANETALQTE